MELICILLLITIDQNVKWLCNLIIWIILNGYVTSVIDTSETIKSSHELRYLTNWGRKNYVSLLRDDEGKRF